MHIQKLLLVLAAMCLFSFRAHAADPKPLTSSSLVVEGVANHPVMALTPEAIRRGRENYQRLDWAKRVGDSITSAADVWLERDAVWIQNHMPGHGASFAYGFAGCPECGGKTAYSTSWASANCTFDNPSHVQCENSHTLPNEKYPDSGKGYKGSDGRMHYFVGIYNAWAVEHFIKGALDLAYAYSLTGEVIYARRGAEILDSLADIYPTCTIGSWDYPESKPGQNHGRLNRPQYQVGRVLVSLANAYDQMFHIPAMEEQSVRVGLTRRQNIEINMLQDGAWYCYNRSFNFNGLTNGEADYIKGAMVVGLVLGMPDYVRWAVDGPYGIRSMLANNIGRDGTYYETATGYSYYTRSIYKGYAEYLLHYRGSAYPDGVNLYQDPRFRDFMLLLNLKTQIGGGIPSYGDAAPVVAKFTTAEKPFDKFDFECLEFLRARVTDPDLKNQYAHLQHWLSDGNPEQYYEKSHASRWFLFHVEPLDNTKQADISDLTSQVMQPNILGQKGFAFLRTGTGEDAQGIMLRYGPALNHANFDDLNFTYYALGHDLTYDLGYHLGSAHGYTGWSKQTASHQLVVVDETSQMTQGAPTGGSLLAFMQGDYTQAVEASAPGPYRELGVEEYARTLFLVNDTQSTEALMNGNLAPSSPYLVDIFRVAGGSKHDSFTHSLGTDVEIGNARQSTTDGTSISLAGEAYAWGDKVLVDGDIAGVPNKPYWVAPPGNGYGFLMDPKSITPTSNSWWADWTIPGGTDHVRVWFPRVEGEKLITARAPGILKHLPNAQYVVRRREPSSERSVFVTVWEPYADEPTIINVECLPLDDDQSSWPAVAVRITHADGTADLLYSSGDETARKFGDVTLSGRLARVAYKDGKVNLVEGLGLTRGTKAATTGTVTKVDAAAGVIEVDTSLADVTPEVDQVVIFSNPEYSRTTAYKIKSIVERNGSFVIELTENCIIGRGVVGNVSAEDGNITSLVSHEYVKPVHRKGDSEFFKGKRITGKSGQNAQIISAGISQPLVLSVDDPFGFSTGDEFIYEDVKVGDGFRILHHVGWRSN